MKPSLVTEKHLLEIHCKYSSIEAKCWQQDFKAISIDSNLRELTGETKLTLALQNNLTNYK